MPTFDIRFLIALALSVALFSGPVAARQDQDNPFGGVAPANDGSPADLVPLTRPEISLSYSESTRLHKQDKH